MTAQVDTRPEGGDRLRAPFTGSAVRIADAPKSIPDALHNLLTSAETLREMISNRTPESAEMAAIEGRWKKNREKRA